MKKQDYTQCVAVCRTRALSRRIYCRNAIRYYVTGRGIACGPTRNVRSSLCRCNGDGLCSLRKAENRFDNLRLPAWPRRSVVGLSPQRLLHCQANRTQIYGVHSVILTVSFHHCCILVFVLILLSPEGRTAEAWEP